jgi:hypothetical protein
MLIDPCEITIAANAKQKTVRDPRRSREHFFNILRDFFDGVALSGRYIDLGPGQFDFAEILHQHGGTCLGVDYDPAVIKLGRYKGFEVIKMDIRDLPHHDFGERFDGVFNKFTLNAFWQWRDDDKHAELVSAIADLAKPAGWAWIGPWNGIPKEAELDQVTVDHVIDLQRRLFEAKGYTAAPLTDAQSRRYGVHGRVSNNIVFFRNLRWHPAF